MRKVGSNDLECKRNSEGGTAIKGEKIADERPIENKVDVGTVEAESVPYVV